MHRNVSITVMGWWIFCSLLGCSACGTNESSSPDKKEKLFVSLPFTVERAQIQGLEMGMSKDEVEEQLGTQGIEKDVPGLVYKTTGGGFYWLAFFPLDLGPSDPRINEDKLSTIVFCPKGSVDGRIEFPEELAGQKVIDVLRERGKGSR